MTEPHAGRRLLAALGLAGEPPPRRPAPVEANPRVELCFLDEHHNQVRLTGVAEIVTDRAILQEIWEGTPLLRHFLGTPDHPEFVLYRIVPTRARYMQEWALECFEVPLP